MTRVIHQRNYGVYVHDERGCPHHNPHAHIKHRGRRIASVHLVTLALFDVAETVPASLLDEIRDEQERILAKWGELNP